MSHAPTYRHLGLERGWPLFQRSGLEILDSGALALARVPTLEDAVEHAFPPLPGFEGPAGVGVDPCGGDVYIADPARHLILRLPACDGAAEPLPCLRGPGRDPGRLLSPRGVAVDSRRVLYVADSGNRRVVLVDLASGQLVGVWGESAPGEALDPSLPGAFHEPWDVAVDSRGRVYVADPGARSPGGAWFDGHLQRFSPGGRPDGAFARTLASQAVRPGAPTSVAIGALPDEGDGAERVLVLDSQPPAILVYDLRGAFDAAATARWERAAGDVGAPAGLALGNGVLYLADASTGRVLLFDSTGAFLGTARGRDAPVAGIAVDCRGRLVVHPGGGGALRRALGRPSFTGCGTFLAGPFDAASDPTLWQQLRLDVDPLEPGADLRLFTLTSDTLDGGAGAVPEHPALCGALPAVPTVAAEDPAPAPLERWRAAPWNATELLVHNEPGAYLWLAGLLGGDGSVTPVIRQIRLQHDETGWIRHLPAIYRRDPIARTFLERALALFEGALDEEDRLIEELPLLFDPYAAPDRADSAWLDWLGDWVDAALEGGWPEERRRRRTAGAFRAHARRGTLEGIRDLVALYTGATPFLLEAGAGPTPWSLGASPLGFDTALAAAAAQGAVAGTSAVVERSHLLDAEDYGAPLFDDVAHHFLASVYEAELPADGGLDRVRRVLDREKPAHTTYHLCAIAPRMRVGYQASLGIDAIVAGPLPAAPLDGRVELGRTSVLGEPRDPGAATGAEIRVGIGSTLA